MQNLKSLDNLNQKPVLGKNDNHLAMVGHEMLNIYSYEQETMDMLKEIDEPQRKLLARQLLVDSYQS